MNWINLSDAENKLKNSEFSDAEALKYLIASMIMRSLLGFGFIEANWIKSIGVVLGIVVSIWGIKAVFKENLAGDGIDFFKRYIVISWIIGFRLFLLSFFIIFPFSLITHLLKEQLIGIQINEIFYAVFGLIFSIIYYSQFIKSIKRISSK